MKLPAMFGKPHAGTDHVQNIIRTELLFLLEPDERLFSRQLLAHLLDEGCNLPLVIAKPRFYELMLAGILATLASGKQQEIFREKLDKTSQPFLDHKGFVDLMRFCRTSLNVSPKQMAIEVTKTIETITREWALDDLLFQEDAGIFESRLQAIMQRLSQDAQTSSRQNVPAASIPLSLVRRRLYIAMTTSLVRYLKDGTPFQTAFGSIPEALHAMQEDHKVFCRCMRLCQEHIPYFAHVASQTFWRTLETLRLENRNI